MINNTYGIAVVCIPSDRLITDENGEQFYECLTQDELQKITQEKDKDLLKTYLFNALSMMDSTISTIATSIEKGLPNSSNKGFNIKAGIIDSSLESPYNPNSHVKIYDSNGEPKGVGIACIVDCPFDTLTNKISKQQKNQNNILNTHNKNLQFLQEDLLFLYEDSHIKAREIFNENNTSMLLIESKNDIFTYEGDSTDALMSGLSGIFASIAKMADKLKIKRRYAK